MIEAAINGLIIYIAVVATFALVVRLIWTDWWVKAVGRHLTLMIFSLAAAFLTLSASLIWGPLPRIVWVLVLFTIAAAVTWRAILQVKSIRRN